MRVARDLSGGDPTKTEEAYLKDDPLWYKDAIIYEVHIKSFKDSNGDGIGDFHGATEKLGYLEELGITALWLLPFYPSPLKDDGYDITDYFNVHPDYGDIRSFKRFMREAHSRGIRVITELVLNHTSDQHPWFQRARRAKPGSSWRNFYVWSDTPDRYKEARIIFQDFERSNWTWDPVAGAYYWHRFYSHQPDLNYDNPLVRKAMIRAIDFWLEMGVDGMRFDAVPYLFEREGTACENLPETHAFLKEVRAHIDQNFKDKMILAEANQWPEDAAAYFGHGDECHMAFHFPLMPRIFMSVQMEDQFPVADILAQTPKIPDNCQWALFLRNHDELTLEMVTDEERDYMYRVYAQDPRSKINLGIKRRLAPLLGNNRSKIELVDMLLLSLPGTPVIYYGDEIGMGDNYFLGDRNGVRTPMQWSKAKNAGFSDANPQQLYLPVIADPKYNYEIINVENQESCHTSLLWWLRQAIGVRKRLGIFGRGEVKVLDPGNPKVFAFTSRHQDDAVLVVANFSRFPQPIELDLSGFEGMIPEESFSRSPFPRISGPRYAMTAGPYDCYWFALKQEAGAACAVSRTAAPEIRGIRWEDVLEGKTRSDLEKVLPGYPKCCRWFESNRTVQSARVLDYAPISDDLYLSYLMLMELDYIEGLPDNYLLPISFAPADKSATVSTKYPEGVMSRLKIGGSEGIIYDGTFDENFRNIFLQYIAERKKVRSESGQFIFYPAIQINLPEGKAPESEVARVEPGSTYIIYKDAYFLKVYRYLEEGANHSFEMVRFLSDKKFKSIPQFAGGIEYRGLDGKTTPLAVLQKFVPNEGNAWNYTVDEIGRYFERVLSTKLSPPGELPDLLDVDPGAIPQEQRALIGGVYLEMAHLIGEMTAEMHLTLATSDEPGFSPEDFSVLYQRSIYQSMRTSAHRDLASLERWSRGLPEGTAKNVEAILSSKDLIMERLKKVTQRKISGQRIRIHGDFGLEHLLYTGKDFLVFGFGGRCDYTSGERRLKRSPLRDAATMILSFCRAVQTALAKRAPHSAEEAALLDKWGQAWNRYVSWTFVRSYLDAMKGAASIPGDEEELRILLGAFLHYRSLYDFGDQLHPAEISVKVILHTLEMTDNRRNGKA